MFIKNLSTRKLSPEQGEGDIPDDLTADVDNLLPHDDVEEIEIEGTKINLKDGKDAIQQRVAEILNSRKAEQDKLLSRKSEELSETQKAINEYLLSLKTAGQKPAEEGEFDIDAAIDALPDPATEDNEVFKGSLKKIITGLRASNQKTLKEALAEERAKIEAEGKQRETMKSIGDKLRSAGIENNPYAGKNDDEIAEIIRTTLTSPEQLVALLTGQFSTKKTNNINPGGNLQLPAGGQSKSGDVMRLKKLHDLWEKDSNLAKKAESENNALFDLVMTTAAKLGW